MSGGDRFEVIVVGGGIIGAACADALSSDGRRVLLLERNEVGSGTTRAGMGHVVVTAGAPEMRALCRYSQQLWHGRQAGWGVRVPIDRCGTMWLGRGDAEQPMIDRLHRTLREDGISAELLGPAAIREREPSVGPSVDRAVRVPEDLVVDAGAATRELVAESRARGAEVRERTAVAHLADAGVQLADGSIVRADAVIVAGGVDSVALLPELGLRPRKGQLAHLDTPAGFLREQLAEIGYSQSSTSEADEVVSFNVQPPPRGGLYLGASRQFGVDRPDVEPRILGRLYERARDYLPGLERFPVLREWTGFRPASPDHRPFIGAWPGRSDRFVAAGHEGLGITTSLGTGRALADLFAGRTPHVALAPFGPMGRLTTDAPGGRA